jgi:SAM-dependent methyltransferase
MKYGTDTGGYFSPDELRSSATDVAAHNKEADAMNNGYSAVAPSVFRDACRRWRAALPSPPSGMEAYSFVDVGAGKGRALLLASELPFRKVIGVELNEALARIAERNIAHWNRLGRPKAKIRIMREDIQEFRWPRTPLLVFLNNPFECELVGKLAVKLADVADAGPRLLDIIYVNPACADRLTGAGGANWRPPTKGSFELLWNVEIPMDPADQLSDPYGAIADRVAAFRLRT